MRLALELTGEEFRNLGTALIVEGWDNRKNGRQRRIYHQCTTQTERRIVAAMYPRLYRYELVSGYPDEILLKPSQITAIRHAAAAFAMF